eukprot:2269042-Prymnesium_polylepis.1
MFSCRLWQSRDGFGSTPCIALLGARFFLSNLFSVRSCFDLVKVLRLARSASTHKRQGRIGFYSSTWYADRSG